MGIGIIYLLVLEKRLPGLSLWATHPGNTFFFSSGSIAGPGAQPGLMDSTPVISLKNTALTKTALSPDATKTNIVVPVPGIVPVAFCTTSVVAIIVPRAASLNL
ncbi:MAG: hypothetical protein JXB26_06415 [Candidatus Aminicenantes bacterium]|nr:hypothetical protein [Candidatus Aminicenantes bacterium]